LECYPKIIELGPTTLKVPRRPGLRSSKLKKIANFDIL